MERTCRQSVEGALTLDVGELFRRGALARGSRTRGVISWFGPAGDAAASVSYEADMTGAVEGRLRLRFSTLDARTGDRRQVDQRVARLHLPPGGDQFRSRRAANQTTIANLPDLSGQESYSVNCKGP
jgi:hypothetical protein